MPRRTSDSWTLTEHLENWQRWSLAQGDCWPGDYSLACGPLDDKAIQYKNSYVSAEERIREALNHKEPEEVEAMRLERWVAKLGEPMRTALWLEWIELREAQRMRWLQTREQWQQRRARFLNHILRQRYPGMFHIRDAADYEQAVEAAELALDRALTQWQRAA